MLPVDSNRTPARSPPPPLLTNAIPISKTPSTDLDTPDLQLPAVVLPQDEMPLPSSTIPPLPNSDAPSSTPVRTILETIPSDTTPIIVRRSNRERKPAKLYDPSVWILNK